MFFKIHIHVHISLVTWLLHPRLVVADAAMVLAMSSCTMGQRKDCHDSEYSAAPWSLSLDVSTCERVNVSQTHVLRVIHSLVIFAFAETADEQKGELWGKKGFTAREAAASEWSASDQRLFRSPDADWPHSNSPLFSWAQENSLKKPPP